MKRQLPGLLGGVILGTAAMSAAAATAPLQAARPQLQTALKDLQGIPYREISVAHPERTIVLIRGGPDQPTVSTADDFDRYLALRFRARVIKPAYYGSAERSAWTRAPSLNIALPMSRNAIVKQVLAEVGTTYAGMPRAVREMRMFIRQWDAPSTVIVGESYGAFLGAIAAQARHRGALVLLSPMLATYREIVSASLDGHHALQAPVPPPRLIFGDVDRTSAILDTPARRRQLLEVTSLAYYAPWQDADLGSVLRRVAGRIDVIVGLKDRIGMVTGQEWLRLRANAPDGVRICIDPGLAHQAPMLTAVAQRCLDGAMRARSKRPDRKASAAKHKLAKRSLAADPATST